MCVSCAPEIKNNAQIAAKYHPQFWQEGEWLCCGQMDKLAPGCEGYNLFGDGENLPIKYGLLVHHSLLSFISAYIKKL